VTQNDTVDFDALLMNIKLSHCQLNCHLSMMPCIYLTVLLFNAIARLEIGIE